MQQFYVTGYVGEGARRMLFDLRGMENVRLIDQVIDNKFVRFLYYRFEAVTGKFRRCRFLKKFFYRWFTVLRIRYKKDVQNCILFFNSGFCNELDIDFIKRFKKRNKDVRLVLYVVDPMTGFHSPEHMKIIEEMDIVYSVNKADCEKYSFLYYPLIYSKEAEIEGLRKPRARKKEETDIYYLGSGTDRTEMLRQIYQRCKEEKISADFHVLARNREPAGEGIVFHESAVSYVENLELIERTNCILEIMHEGFDNPTQRYSEAVAYNKKLLTNNKKTVTFDFYNPRYMQVFQSVEEIDVDFINRKESVNYGYEEEFSPKYLIKEISGRCF